MYYVMSDIHGEYDKYIAMLDKINFSDNDVLIVLGDVIDRGPEPVKVLKDMSMRPNVYPVIGNHELMALDILSTLLEELTEDNFDKLITDEMMGKLDIWQRNGGGITLRKFMEIPKDERYALLEYIEEFEPYQIIDIDDKHTMLFVHAGLGNYYDGKSLMEYTLDELTFERPNLNQMYYDDSLTVIVGHTPTLVLSGMAEIYRSGNVMFIDCGATYGGRLACLCLDTMEEYYV